MSNHLEGMADELFEQILSLPPGYGGATVTGGTDPPMTVSAGMLLQMNLGGGGFPATMFPLGLSLDQGKTSFMKQDEASGSDKWFREDAEPKSISSAMKTERDSAVRLPNLFPPFANSPPAIRPTGPQSGQGIVTVQPFMAHPITAANTPHPPSVRPRVRARRGQATDPHSIAERLRRERIAERMKQLQELVPSSNKTDRAAMLDEIVDYVKFLRLQVKVLSMSRLGGAGAVAQLVADIPSPSVEGDANNQPHQEQVWDKWSADGTDRHVAKLMEEDVGAAMQFLQSKDLCLMPISLAFAIYHPHQPVDISAATRIKPEHSNLQ